MTTSKAPDNLPALVRDPSRISELDPDVAANLLSELEALRVRLWRRACRPSDPGPSSDSEDQNETAHNADTRTWREKIWTAPAETRLGTEEVAQALGRPVSWVHKRTGEKAKEPPLPCGKLGGVLTFKAGEIRTWIRENETPRNGSKEYATNGQQPAQEVADANAGT